MRAAKMLGTMTVLVVLYAVLVAVVATPEALVFVLPTSIIPLYLLWLSAHVPTLYDRYVAEGERPTLEDDADRFHRAHLPALHSRHGHHA